MAMFVDPNARVAVTLDGNTIYIRSKMSAGVRAAVQDEMRARGFKSQEELSISGIGSYRLALMEHNIVAWEGPAFLDEKGRPIPCTRLNIRNLDPTEPLVEAVAEEIGERNTAPETPKGTDPN